MFDVRTVFNGSGRLAVGGSRDLAGPGAAAFLVLAAAWQLAGRQSGWVAPLARMPWPCAAWCRHGWRMSFAICSPVGSGAWSGTALADVLAAHRRGACVRWYAGGPPALDLSARLASRSRALGLHSAAGCLVAVSSPRSPGSFSPGGRCCRASPARGGARLRFPLVQPGAPGAGWVLAPAGYRMAPLSPPYGSRANDRPSLLPALAGWLLGS